MPPDDTSASRQRARALALHGLAVSAADNIPGVDFASITLARADQSLHTIAATEHLAEELDAIQYELREGPCYAAVTNERLILLEDVAGATRFSRYAARAADLGVGSQAAFQLVHNGEQAGLNLYACTSNVFDRSTLEFAELFATHAAALLQYVEQVEQLGEALHTRTDIGIAIGILMERYGIDRHRAFAFLSRNSQNRNSKIRVLAQQIIDGTFQSTSIEDSASHEWP